MIRSSDIYKSNGPTIVPCGTPQEVFVVISFPRKPALVSRYNIYTLNPTVGVWPAKYFWNFNTFFHCNQNPGENCSSVKNANRGDHSIDHKCHYREGHNLANEVNNNETVFTLNINHQKKQIKEMSGFYFVSKLSLNTSLCPEQPAFLNSWLSSVSTTDMCQPWLHQPAFRQWISITHCPRRCLPSRSHPPMPAMPCLCLLLSTTPTLWRMTSLCCAATRCPSTTPRARSPTGSNVAPI